MHSSWEARGIFTFVMITKEVIRATFKIARQP